MLDMVKKLYDIAGKQSKRITKMLIFDVLKTMFEGMTLFGVIFLLIKVCDSVILKNPVMQKDIYTIVIIMLISVLGKITTAYMADRNKYIASYEMGAEIRLSIGDKLKKVNMGFFNQNRLGEVTGGLTTVITDLETIGIPVIENILTGTIQTIIMAIFIVPFDVITGIIILVTLFIGILCNGLIQNRTDLYTRKLQGYKIDLNASMLEYVMGIGVIKAFGKTNQALNKLRKAIKDNRKGYLDVERIIAPFQFLYLSIFKVSICVIIFTSLYRYGQGSLNVQKTIILIVSSFFVFSGIELAGLMQSMRGVAVQNLDTIYELRKLSVINEGDIRNIDNADIKVDNIEFAYENENVIKNLSCHIPVGKTTALVGPSGCGKSTLCYLISRFWDVNSGAIKIYGNDVRSYNYDYLLSNISMVFQDVYLFEDTVKNNIRFGKPDATDEEVIDIAKKACCHDFIMKLPQGYDTILKEGGKSLSGGERQRISIARAMLKEAKLVILDEATSSIDPENEKSLLKALKVLLKDKTAIIIAHRLSTIRHADRIIVMDNGKIVQQGKHDELIKQKGIYHDFVKIRNEAIAWKL